MVTVSSPAPVLTDSSSPSSAAVMLTESLPAPPVKVKSAAVPSLPPLNVLLFGEFVETHYLPFVKLRKRSWMTDQSIFKNHLLPRFSVRPLNDIHQSDILQLQNEMSVNYASGTCNRVLVLLKYVLNCARKWKFLPKDFDPCAGVAPFEDNGARERYLTKDEVRKLFNALDSSPNKQVAVIVRLLLLTGARKREILDATWNEIDFVNKVLVIPSSRSKSKRQREIPLSEGALQLFCSVKRHDNVAYVFINSRTGKPPMSIFHAWDSIRKKAGLENLRLHDLRHSYASFLINSGRTLYEVQRLLGRQDPKVTMRYAHLSRHQMLDAANTVDRIIRD